MPRVTDATDEMIRDSSHGPGDDVKRVANAKPARNQTPQMIEALAAWERKPDKTMGNTSKALAYSRHALPRGKRDHANFIRLIKGGHLRVCEVFGPPPEGSNAKRESPYSDRYFIIRAGACPPELPTGALEGRKKPRRR